MGMQSVYFSRFSWYRKTGGSPGLKRIFLPYFSIKGGIPAGSSFAFVYIFRGISCRFTATSVTPARWAAARTSDTSKRFSTGFGMSPNRSVSSSSISIRSSGSRKEEMRL